MRRALDAYIRHHRHAHRAGSRVDRLIRAYLKSKEDKLSKLPQPGKVVQPPDVGKWTPMTALGVVDLRPPTQGIGPSFPSKSVTGKAGK
jgi:hypothetical protein